MHLSVRAKIILIVIVILIVASGTQIVANSIVFSEEYSDALKSKAVVIGKGLKVQLDRLLRLGISLENLVGFEKQCQDIVYSYEEISHAMVISTDGIILFHNDPTQMGSVLSDSKILEAMNSGEESIHVSAIDGKKYYIVIIPVFDTIGEYIGVVSVDFPEELITKKTETLISQSIILSSIFFSLAIVFMIAALSTWVTKPLKNLVAVIQDIKRSGDLDKRAQIYSKDELGELASTFNRMTSDLKRSKRKLHDYNKTLEEKVKERTLELTRSNTELEQFAYVASHDLQEPLRMVSSYLQLLERRYKDKLDNDALEFINFAVDGASRMQRMINDLLTYSRVGTRGKPFEPTDTESVIKQAKDNLKVAIDESGAVITYDPLPTVMADSSQLLQLSQNLIGNSIKFKGTEAPQINIAAAEKENEWLFSVRDNGIGIEPKDKEQIFEIFQRLHSREEYPGTGIGLAVCKKIVERHGGRIWVESEPGKGSTFYFTVKKFGVDGT